MRITYQSTRLIHHVAGKWLSESCLLTRQSEQVPNSTAPTEQVAHDELSDKVSRDQVS